ncbi:MAG: TIGR04211 family SH3 domain-containing protein [Nitrospirota bacterium]|nr:TIGR04211 family SH3 domain-containing protein [Nitrospirota bacterium]
MRKKIAGSIYSMLFVFIFIFAAGVHQAGAETQYVSDSIVITMRAGKGDQYRVIRTLRTGTPLEILEEDSRYLKVKTPDGTEGWVLKRYISARKPKNLIISDLENQTDRLRNNLAALEKERDELKDELRTFRKNLKAAKKEGSILTKKLQWMTTRYNTLAKEAKNVTELIDERNRLQAENNSLSEESSRLMQENERHKRNEKIKWFLAGGGVFFVGWISGKLSRKKKRIY